MSKCQSCVFVLLSMVIRDMIPLDGLLTNSKKLDFLLYFFIKVSNIFSETKVPKIFLYEKKVHSGYMYKKNISSRSDV